MRPSHDNIKRDQDTRDQTLVKNVESLLSDLVAKDSTKGDLMIGAKVLRLAKSMNIYDSSMEKWELILKGENKHKKDFCALLESELS